MDKARLVALSEQRPIPPAHVAYLRRLRREGWRPRVIYDIGACVLSWTRVAREVWPDATFVLFDAYAPAAFLYDGYLHHVGVLSDEDGREVRFYESDEFPSGNSYYREAGPRPVFPEDAGRARVARTLDAVVRERGFPRPDLVKIDVQGAERDVIAGGLDTLRHASQWIVEMQHIRYNAGAPLAPETLRFIEGLGYRCAAPRFCDNGPDADYGFVRADALDCEGPWP